MNMPILAQDIHILPLDMQDRHEVARYDAYVRAHPHSTAYHLSHWGRAVEKALGHRCCYLVAQRHRAIIGILPLMEVKSWLFGSVLVSASLAMRAGPLTDTQTARDALDQAAWAMACQKHIPVLEYRCAASADPAWHDSTGIYANFARALSDDSATNMKAIPRKQRAEVRKALDLGLECRVGSTDVDRAQHYHVYAASVHQLGTPVLPHRLFAAILELYDKDADILTVLHQGTPLASVLSLYHKDRVYPHYGGGLYAARQWRANDHMYWQLMEHARRKGMRCFDFGRSKYGTGAFDFKKNWGFTPEPLHYGLRLAEGQSPPDLNPQSPRYQMLTGMWKKLPRPLANRIGPMISRHFY